MSRVGFWQLLLDDKISPWEANAINSAHDEASRAQLRTYELSGELGALRNRVDALSREVVMLRAAVTVLVRTLKDTEVLDERLLDARLEAAIDEAFAPPEPPPRAATARDTPPEPERTTVCLRCRQTVPAHTTTLTGDGPVCDRCPGT